MAKAKSKFVSFRTSEEEYEEIKKFASFQGVSMTSLFLDSVREKIEDWEDIRDYELHLRQKSAEKRFGVSG